MTDSYVRAKNSLIAMLGEDENAVIALVGKWGTGKTYLWGEIEKREEFKDRKIINISLFGAKSVKDLKLRIIEQAALKDHPNYQAFTNGAVKVGKSLLTKLVPETAMEELVLLSFQTLVKDSLVVLDDVERKHASLDTEELMGLLSECKDQSRTRFLLLLNRDQLKDREMWDTLHEKMIDGEIVLDPTSSEAFKVSKYHASCPYPEAVEMALTILKINNIRGINRIVKVAQKMLGGCKNLSSEAVAELVPAVVLLTAILYRVAPGAPTASYILNYNSTAHLLSKDRSKEDIERDALLRQLGIQKAGHFTQVLMTYLETGILDGDKLASAIEEYRHSAELYVARSESDAFFTALYWEPEQTPDSLETLALKLRNHLDYIDAVTVTVIFDKLKEIGKEAAGDQIIMSWISKYNMRVKPEEGDARRNSHYRIDDRIIQAIDQKYDEKFPPLSIEAAVAAMRKTNGWGQREIDAFARATPSIYEETLKRLTGEPLAVFILGNIDLMKLSGMADDHPIRIGLKSFAKACENIRRQQHPSRLSQILERALDCEKVSLSESSSGGSQYV